MKKKKSFLTVGKGIYVGKSSRSLYLRSKEDLAEPSRSLHSVNTDNSLQEVGNEKRKKAEEEGYSSIRTKRRKLEGGHQPAGKKTLPEG